MMGRRPGPPLALALGALLLGCDGSSTDPVLEGGLLATFEVSGETFELFTTNPQTIADILALDAGTSDASIPNGALRRGAGPSDYNAPWGWHMDPEDVSMAEVTIELCDGRPSMVDEDLDYWIDTVGRFCPWSAQLIGVEDLR
jgi:hypothetical protein